MDDFSQLGVLHATGSAADHQDFFDIRREKTFMQNALSHHAAGSGNDYTDINQGNILSL
jgi:hypothetical protein